MANEVIIEEYGDFKQRYNNGLFVPIAGALLTSQILTIGVASSQFSHPTAYIRLMSKGTGFWYILGGASPDAVANTAGNRWLPADQWIEIPIRPGVDLKLDTA